MESDVVNGKYFYNNSNVRKIGTLKFTGNSNASNVLKGKTFYSTSKNKQTGSFSLIGTAQPEDVLVGKTFYNTTLTKQTGTMPNIGRQTGTINIPVTGDVGGQISILKGFHDGTGVITATTLTTTTATEPFILNGYQAYYVNGTTRRLVIGTGGT